MMDRRLVKLLAVWCIELMILLPVLTVYAYSISNTQVEISGTIVTIDWDTSAATNSSFVYWLYSGSQSDSSSVTDSSYKLNHTVTLSGLSRGSRYAYTINTYTGGTSPESNAQSGQFTVPDSTPPPQPTGLQLINATEFSVEITWDEYNTSEVTDLIHYMIYRNGINIYNTTTNTYLDENLNALTTYVYNIAGRDASGNTGDMSNSLLVTTLPPDEVAPNIYNLQVVGVSNTSAIVYWETDEQATSKVYYGGSVIDKSATTSGYHMNHTVTLNSLTPNNNYNYIASSCDASGNCRNASRFTFRAGGDTTPPSLSVNVPSIYNSGSMPVNGTTEALVSVFFYLNGNTGPSAATQANINGEFSTSISLDTSQSENTLIVEARDSAGNTKQESFTITVDIKTPSVNISTIPILSNSSSLRITGNVSEDVILNMYIDSEGDSTLTAPSMVTGVTNSSVTSSSVRLTWTANNASEQIDYYRVYRNSVIVGTSSGTTFNDCTNEDTSYTYQIAAVNDNCDEGAFSDTVSVQTPTGSNCSGSNTLSDTCGGTAPTRSVNINQGSFTQSVPLEEGTNEIRLQFVDEANNSVDFYETVIHDSKAPTITWNNLATLTPTTDDEITVKGTVDEQATVTITVNNDSSYIGSTDADGNFSIEIDLEKIDYDTVLSTAASANQVTGNVVTGKAVTNQNYYSYQTGNEDLETTSLEWTADDGVYDNLITIVATDSVGKESSAVEDYLEYRMCSFGSWWSITISDPQPSMIIPRHLLNGIAQINYNFELEWLGGTGGTNDTIPSVSTSWDFRDLSPEEEDAWDDNWFSRPRVSFSDANRTQGYVVISSKTLNRYVSDSSAYRRDLNVAINTNSTENFTTTLEMEQNVSDHRKGECIISQFGCVRLPLVIELDFTDPDYTSTTGITGSTSSTYSGQITQRQCIDVEIAIDVRIDTNIIPESFLESAIDFLNSTIDLIDSILEPINDVKEYVLYACLGTWIWMYIKAYQKRWKCEFSGGITGLITGGFKTIIAEQGLCYYTYGDPETLDDDDPNKKKAEDCIECRKAVKIYKDAEELMQNLCDRIACPSAPSFMKYVRTMKTTSGSTVKVNIKSEDGKNTDSMMLTQQSDCKDFPLDSFEAIELQYRVWKKYKEDRDALKFDNPFQEPAGSGSASGLAKTTTEKTKKSCFEPHAYNPNCCVVEYMRTYDSACGLSGGIPGVGEGVLFDEMKESYCVAGSFSQANQTNQDTPGFTSPAGVDLGDLPEADYAGECEGAGRTLWNAIAGICEQSPAEQQSLVKTSILYRTSATDGYLSIGGTTGAGSASSSTAADRADIFSGGVTTTPTMTIYDTDTSTTASGSTSDKVVLGGDSNGCPTTLRPNDNHYMFYVVRPKQGTSGDTAEYVIQRGMVLKNIDLTNAVVGWSSSSFGDYGDVPIASSDVFRPLVTLDANWFKVDVNEGAQDTDTRRQSDYINPDGFSKFKDDMEDCASGARGTVTGAALTSTQSYVYGFLQGRQGSTVTELKASFTPTGDFTDNDLDKLVRTTPGLLDGSGKLTDVTSSKSTIESSVATIGGTASPITESYIQDTYKKIQQAMGVYDKDEIVDPTSSFLRSVQCLCLPGITGYLKLWRAIMVAVKACLYTILITGDGNPGVCRAVLTQYVCDLIYDLIKCIANRYSVGYQREVGTESAPGNILATLTSAGGDVQRSIAGRYGESSFFRAMFAERQLVHAICLWAFTGTFDFDFSALVDGEYGDVPVDSQGLLAPCQRRFISYNSANAGRTTWNYYFGVGLVAGADLTYRLRLQCSQGMDCDYGSGNEACDCSDKDSSLFRSITLSGASTSMSRYDVLEEEYDDTITSDVRYDTVLLEYTYTDKDNDRVTKNVSCDINTVGGSPPGYCAFDPLQGIYKCDVDVGDEDYVQLTGYDDPKSQSPYWRIGDYLTINAHITQALPDTLECTSASSCSNTKYLSIELKDHNGNTVLDPLTTGSYRPLLINGQMTYSLPSTPFSIVSSAVSSSSSSLACKPDNVATWIPSCVNDFGSIADTLAITVPGGYGTVVKGGGTNCTISATNTAACKFPAKGGGLKACVCKKGSKYLTVNLRASDGGITGTLYPPTGTITLKPSGATSGTASGTCSGEVVWTGNIRIYENQGSGSLYTISDSIYEYQGTPQVQPFSIRINCDSSTSTSGTSTSSDFTDVVPDANAIIDAKGLLTSPTIATGARKISLEAVEALNSAYVKITKSGGSPVGYNMVAVSGSTTKFEYTWNIGSAASEKGTYTIELIVRTAASPSLSKGKVYTIIVS